MVSAHSIPRIIPRTFALPVYLLGLLYGTYSVGCDNGYKFKFYLSNVHVIHRWFIKTHNYYISTSQLSYKEANGNKIIFVLALSAETSSSISRKKSRQEAHYKTLSIDSHHPPEGRLSTSLLWPPVLVLCGEGTFTNPTGFILLENVSSHSGTRSS